jgi:hypothetical protein
MSFSKTTSLCSSLSEFLVSPRNVMGDVFWLLLGAPRGGRNLATPSNKVIECPEGPRWLERAKSNCPTKDANSYVEIKEKSFWGGRMLAVGSVVWFCSKREGIKVFKATEAATLGPSISAGVAEDGCSFQTQWQGLSHNLYNNIT